MATELTVPSLGMDMQEATIVKWLVEEGDTVEKGDPILEIDTDKTSFEVEATESGEIRNLTGAEGETLAVGALLAHILAPGEDPPEIRESEEAEESATDDSETDDSETDDSETDDSETDEPEAAEPESTESADSHEEVSGPDDKDSGEDREARRVRASPAARKVALERGLELSEVPGSGPNGRVYLSDIVNFESPEGSPEKESKESGSEAGQVPVEEEGVEESGFRRESLSQVRRIGAERTQKSFAEVPHFYLRRDLDAEGLVDLREKLKARLEVAPSLNDLISFAVCRTLKDHPRLNARFDSGELVVSESVNLGVAAATEKGLLVPVVKNADDLRLRDLSRQIRDLLEKARDGKLGRDELSGGTFTISNLGMMGVDSFDAIINQPEAAILAVGRLRTAPEWEDGEWVPRRRISVTLSVDHRVADGADGARFLEDLQAAVTDWELLM